MQKQPPNETILYAEEGDVTIAQMSVLIRQGDMDGAPRLLQEFLGIVPYCNNTNYEEHYQQLLFIIFTLLTHFVVDVEVHYTLSHGVETQ